MANFSIELGNLVKSFNIFDFPYDFYDDTKKADFESLFIDKFYNYEIGVETPLRFKRNLSVVMRTKFPKYNMLLKSAQIEYSVLDNYNLTETQSRNLTNTNNTTGSNTLHNSLLGSESSSSNTSSTNESTDIGSKTNNLDSVTDHTDTFTIDRTESEEDSSTVTLGSEKTLDATKVHSVTPKSLLSLETIKTHAYASDADRNDNTETEETETETSATKQNDVKETDKRTVKDIVNADNVEATRVDNDSHGTTTATGSGSHSETNDTTGTSTQNSNGTTTETYTLNRHGNIGVDTDADMIQKHIKLQERFATIYDDFFENECYDLFYQLWN